ncbi:MAG: hypothetical protein OXI46_05915 [Gemmatimonadota bacterium]|nr:hypothetical protein [Gemmatimonadota bacterium]
MTGALGWTAKLAVAVLLWVYLDAVALLLVLVVLFALAWLLGGAALN